MGSRVSFGLVVILFFLFPCLSAAQSANRVTILYDAFGKNASMKKDWGFAALIEVNGMRILFDTGDSPDILRRTSKRRASISVDSILSSSLIATATMWAVSHIC
jgi:hypothetical protein